MYILVYFYNFVVLDFFSHFISTLLYFAFVDMLLFILSSLDMLCSLGFYVIFGIFCVVCLDLFCYIYLNPLDVLLFIFLLALVSVVYLNVSPDVVYLLQCFTFFFLFHSMLVDLYCFICITLLLRSFPCHVPWHLFLYCISLDLQCLHNACYVLLFFFVHLLMLFFY
ncbi:hypothetical protein DsansV1_C13g0117071 [Dioscorea sansibarensis]